MRTLAVVASDVAGTTGTRQERKQRTRQALMDAALALLADRGLASLSLRAVAHKVGIVPTAFYRHFASVEDLGVALVEESMRTLRKAIREARRGAGTGDAIKHSVRILAEQVKANQAHFRFISRERHGGVPDVRRAIAMELRLFVSELATDLGRFPGTTEWDGDDLRMVADLMVTHGLSVATALLEGAPLRPDDERELLTRAEHQLRLIVLGMSQWRPVERQV